MQYRMLGRSGLKVSAIGLGGNSWGAAGRRTWAAYDEAASRPLIHKALEAGITLFDTADNYNEGESETILGRCLWPAVKRHDVVILTKTGMVKGSQPSLSRNRLIRSCEESLKRLGTDYIDLFLLHRLDGVTPLEETLEALTDLVRAGKVRYIGGSTMPAYRMAQLATMAARDGYARPVAMQNLYNLIYREEEAEMNPLCVDMGIGLTPYSPLARGVLSATRNAEGSGESDRSKGDAQVKNFDYFRPSDAAVIERLRKVAEARGVSPAQVALAWLLAKPGMASPIIGGTKESYITTAVAALDVKLTAEEIKSLEEPYQPRPWAAQ